MRKSDNKFKLSDPSGNSERSQKKIIFRNHKMRWYTKSIVVFIYDYSPYWCIWWQVPDQYAHHFYMHFHLRTPQIMHINLSYKISGSLQACYYYLFWCSPLGSSVKFVYPYIFLSVFKNLTINCYALICFHFYVF